MTRLQLDPKRYQILRLLVLAAAVVAPVRCALAQGRLEVRRGDTDLTGALRLVRESLRITIDHQYARTTLHQTFVNESEASIEGRYVLVAGEGALVDGFAYWNGEKKIVGEVFEKEAARAVYEEVSGLGRDPGLLEQVGEGAFSFRVFPIAPHEEKRVEVRFGRMLARRGRTVEYRLPLEAPEAEVLLDIDDARGLTNLGSSTHTLSVESSPGHLRVRATPRLAERHNDNPVDNHGESPTDSQLGKLLLVRYDIDEQPMTLSSLSHRDAGQPGYVTVRMAMPAVADRAAIRDKDLTIVIDRSGSMTGAPLDEALKAAEAVVGRLRERDKLNVISFDDGVDALYSTPHAFDAHTREEALLFIRMIRAGGGTDIAKALGRALSAQTNDGAPHLVLFLTDGQSSSEEALKVARGDKGDARVFTIGLGSGVEKPLLSRLAADKRGRFAFIAGADQIQAKVAHLFEQIESPLLTDLTLTSDGVALTSIYPRTLPDLVAGDELVVEARSLSSGPVEITLSGQLAGKPVVRKTRAVIADSGAKDAGSSHPWIGKLWARARIDDLLEDIALFGERDELKNEVIDLALAYNQVTPYSSFLAIPESELTDAAKGTLASARQKKAQVMAAHKDAAALSRSDMPPGDPVLSVSAPRDARQVTAYFPFGLVKDLRFDESVGRWQVRFLVPRTVLDGDYVAQVMIVRADGSVEVATASYHIDSAAPDFEVSVQAVQGGVRIVVISTENVDLAQVALASDPRVRTLLSRVQASFADAGARGLQRWEGVLALPAGCHDLRVVVADAARNEADQVISAEVP